MTKKIIYKITLIKRASKDYSWYRTLAGNYFYAILLKKTNKDDPYLFKPIKCKHNDNVILCNTETDKELKNLLEHYNKKCYIGVDRIHLFCKLKKL